MTVDIRVGDCRELLAQLADGSARCCVTSPPFWGLRDYGVDGQIGLESSPDDYVAELLAVFAEVWRVLAEDGTLWLNLGDCYSGAGGGWQGRNGVVADGTVACSNLRRVNEKRGPGLKPKDLVGMPWRVAFALQAAGWYLRSDIVWHKPNPMPEPVKDRPTRAHEFMFLLTKARRYYYDGDAIREPAVEERSRNQDRHNDDGSRGRNDHLGRSFPWQGDTRNKRDVWTITTKPFRGAHFAVMPPELVEPCVLAGSEIGDTVLDPFMGAGTVGLVARRLQRRFVGIELNPVYADMARQRIGRDAPLFNRADPLSP